MSFVQLQEVAKTNLKRGLEKLCIFALIDFILDASPIKYTLDVAQRRTLEDLDSLYTL